MDPWSMRKAYWNDTETQNSVLPPPPKYGTGQYPGAPLLPIVETHNHINYPTGPKCRFLVGEGTYVLKEELRLACPPPHPTESTTQNPNPLATTKQLPTCGTKMSLLSFDPNSMAPNHSKGSSVTTSSLNRPSTSIQEHLVEDRQSIDGNGSLSNGHEASHSEDSRRISVSDGFSTVHSHDEGNALLSSQSNGKESGKRKKPKSNMSKSNSSFISRSMIHESLSKRIQEHNPSGHYMFVNCNRSFQWIDFSSPTKAEYFIKVLFTKGHCLTHDVNQVTKAPSHIDVILGFNTGEIIWWEPFSQRYTRINKNGIICNSPVQSIKWLPGSENLFIAGHGNGTIIVYDKEREDAPINKDEEPKAVGQDFGAMRSRMRIEKSVFSKNQKTNPISLWRPNCSGIQELAFSPDNKYLAVVSSNMAFRLLDYIHERQEDMFSSYFGHFTCVCWSPDGKYIVTGGQDDLITIWSVAEKNAVAWGKGHKAWPSSVAFDPWRCDERNYRFGSVGEDCRLCLWDFNAGMLARPKTALAARRGSVASGTAVSVGPERIEHENGTVEHGPARRDDMPQLIPITSHEADSSVISGLAFTEEAILTSSKAGLIRAWMRPKAI